MTKEQKQFNKLHTKLFCQGMEMVLNAFNEVKENKPKDKGRQKITKQKK